MSPEVIKKKLGALATYHNDLMKYKKISYDEFLEKHYEIERILELLVMTSSEKRVAWFASIAHLFTHGYMTLLPAVFVVIASDQSLRFFTLGAIVNIGYFLFGFGSIPAGILSDEVGPKRMLTLGLFGMATSSILV